MPSSFQIAIDGPVAAGKGTVARLVAQRLGWLYVDTGAMYRAAALLAIKAGIALEDGAGVTNLVNSAKITMRNPSGDERDGRLTTILADGEDISWKIRTEDVSHGSSVVAVHPDVRAVLVRKQQEIAQRENVVMEGRDVTFRVLPKAQLKIFLTADEEERARRRQRQLMERGVTVSYKQVLKDLRARDVRDRTRILDPLHVSKDVWVLDTTSLTVEEVVNIVVTKVSKLGLR